MKFVDEMSDWLYIDELCMKLEGYESTADVYVHNANEKVTIEFEVTDLVRLNNFLNILKGDHENVAKTLGVKMTRYDKTPRKRATELFHDVSAKNENKASNSTNRDIDKIDYRTGVLKYSSDDPINIDHAVIKRKQQQESSVTKQDTAESDYLQEKFSREMGC